MLFCFSQIKWQCLQTSSWWDWILHLRLAITIPISMQKPKQKVEFHNDCSLDCWEGSFFTFNGARLNASYLCTGHWYKTEKISSQISAQWLTRRSTKCYHIRPSSSSHGDSRPGCEVCSWPGRQGQTGSPAATDWPPPATTSSLQ